MKKILAATLTLQIALGSAMAAIPGRARMPELQLGLSHFDFSRGGDWRSIVVYKAEPQFDMSKYVPADFHASDQAGVASQILDHSLHSLLNSDGFKSTEFGRTTSDIEKKMNQDFVLSKKNQIEHKLNFAMKAHQAQMQVRYSGFAEATVTYQALSSTTKFELARKIYSDTELVFDHTDSAATGRSDTVNLRLNF